MGNSSSSTVQQTVSVVTNFMTTIIAQTYNSSSNNFTSTNVQSVTLENSNCKNISETNSLTAVYNVSTYFATSNSAQIALDLTNSITQAEASTNTQVSSFLSSTFNNNNQNTSVSNYLKTNINTLIQNTTFNTCSNNSILSNNQTLVLDNSSGEFCTLTNSTQFQFAATCLVNNIINNSANSSILNVAAQNATDSSTSTTTGAASVVSAFGSIIGDVFGSITTDEFVIFFFISLVILGMGYLFVKLFTSGDNNLNSTIKQVQSSPLTTSNSTPTNDIQNRQEIQQQLDRFLKQKAQ